MMLPRFEVTVKQMPLARLSLKAFFAAVQKLFPEDCNQDVRVLHEELRPHLELIDGTQHALENVFQHVVLLSLGLPELTASLAAIHSKALKMTPSTFVSLCITCTFTRHERQKKPAL